MSGMLLPGGAIGGRRYDAGRQKRSRRCPVLTYERAKRCPVLRRRMRVPAGCSSEEARPEGSRPSSNSTARYQYARKHLRETAFDYGTKQPEIRDQEKPSVFQCKTCLHLNAGWTRLRIPVGHVVLT
eukprot:1215097-Rhodomonas_salina.1